MSFSIVINPEQTKITMNFLVLLILCLTIVGFSLLALGINFFLRKKQVMKEGYFKHEPVKGRKDIRCGCGRGNCCAIE
jgi:hypothetical protein